MANGGRYLLKSPNGRHVTKLAIDVNCIVSGWNYGRVKSDLHYRKLLTSRSFDYFSIVSSRKATRQGFALGLERTLDAGAWGHMWQSFQYIRYVNINAKTICSFFGESKVIAWFQKETKNIVKTGLMKYIL